MLSAARKEILSREIILLLAFVFSIGVWIGVGIGLYAAI